MRNPDRTISDAELNALVDGELLAERRAQVESWLATEPEAAARVESWRRQNEILRAAFSRVALEAVPQALALAIAGPKEKPVRAVPLGQAEAPIHVAPLRQVTRVGRSRDDQQRRMIVFAVVAFLTGGLATLGVAGMLGVMGSRTPQPIPISVATLSTSGQSFARRALEAQAAFAEQDAPPLDLASRDRSAIASFLSQHLHVSVALPVLEPTLRPLGVRLTPGEGGLSGFILYDDGTSARTGVLVGRSGSPDTTGFMTRESSGRSVVWFVAGGLGYGMTGANRDRLIDHALLLRERLNATHGRRD